MSARSPLAIQLAPPRAVTRAARVYVVAWPDIFEPKGRQQWEVPWRDGLIIHDLLPDGWDPDLVAIGRHGKRLDAGDFDELLEREEVVHLGRLPGGPGVGLAGGTIGALGGAISTFTQSITSAFQAAASHIGSQFILNEVRSLFVPDFGARIPNSQSSQVFGWSGIATNFNPTGTPIGLLYGEHELGGSAISIYKRVTNGATPEETLYMLLLIGGGPLQSIGGVTSDADDLTGGSLPAGLEFNGNPARNYSGVTAYVRLGSLHQATIPGFDIIPTTYDVALPIDQVTQESGLTPVVDFSMGASYDFPLGQVGDRMVSVFRFTGGLYKVDPNDGLVKKLTVELQLRYQELDGAGNPIGSPVTPGDVFTVEAKITSPFTHEIETEFADPSTFLPPPLSSAVSLTSAGKHYGEINGAFLSSAFTSFAVGAQPSQFKMFHVLKVDTMKDRVPIFAWGDWVDVGGEDRVEGIVLQVRQTVGTEGQLEVLYGSSTSVAARQLIGGTLEEGEFISVGFEYLDSGPLSSLILYLNGSAVASGFSSKKLQIPAKNIVLNAMPNQETAGTGEFHGDTLRDELRLWGDGDMGPSFAELHNSGAWQTGVATDQGDLMGGWTYDTVAAVSPATSPAYGFDPIIDPTDTVTTWRPTGVTPPLLTGGVTGQVTNVGKRARYRVDWQRLNEVKDSATKKDEVLLESIIVIVDRVVNYSGMGLLAIKMVATDQLQGSPPNVTVPVQGRNDILMFDGIDPENPSFTKGYTANPAWCFAHAHLDKADGAGHIYDTSMIDWAALLEWANDCDEEVYDQKSKFGGAETPLSTVTLRYAAAVAGFPNGVLKIVYAQPLQSHLVPGKRVRLEQLTDPAPSGEYPEGDFTVEQIDLDTASTYELWIHWPAGLAAPLDVDLEDTAAVFYGIEERFRCDLPLVDRGLAALEVRDLIAQTGRGVPVSLGDKVGVTFDRSRPPVATFNAANVVRGSVKIGARSRRELPNILSGEFQSKDLGYDRQVVEVTAASLSSTTGARIARRGIVDKRGVTRQSQVVRDLGYQVNVHEFIRMKLEFRASLDTLLIEKGDVFVFAHPLPNWNHGGRLAQTSADGTELYVDTPIILGSRNLLEGSHQLDQAPWFVFAETGPDPEVTATGLPGPDGELNAVEVTFKDGSTNALFFQGVPHRGAGTDYSGVFWVRIASGTEGSLANHIATATVVAGSELIAITTAWQRFEASGTSGSADATINHGILAPSVSGADIVIEVAKPRLIYGSDDGVDATGLEAPSTHSTYNAAVGNPQHSFDDRLVDVVIVELADQAGYFEPGSRLALAAAEDFGFTPVEGWLWTIGPVTYASRLFQVSALSEVMEHRITVSALEYSEAVYIDENALEPLQTQSLLASLVQQQFSETQLPSVPEFVTLTESSVRDGLTGSLRKGFDVSWGLPRGTLTLVDRVDVWLRELPLGAFERIATVPGSRTRALVSGDELEPGTAYEVAVQPRTRRGLATPLNYAAKARLTYWGLFPLPPQPVAVRAYLVGEQATYEVDLPPRFQDAVVELFRGGTFVGQAIGRIPVGGRNLGPTTDWCVLPPSAAGEGSPPLYARLATPQGARGQHTRLDVELDTSAFPAALLDDSMEDGPWGTAGAGYTVAPILTEFETEESELDGLPDRLHFAAASAELEGAYESTVYDIGRARRVHVSFGIEGTQVAPWTVEQLQAPVHRYERSLTGEGYLDPQHPRYAELGVFLEWAFSTTAADPGTTYVPFRCGPASIRSCRFRIRVVRPSTAWDVWIARAGCSIRPMPKAEGGGLDAGEVTS